MTKQIVICDDENLVRTMLSDYFSGKGYDVAEAQNGVECIERVTKTSKGILAIFLDIRMPKMDGIATVRELRKRGVSAPIFLMSGFGDITSADQVSSLGATRFFAKPFPLESLSKAVAQI